MKLWMLVAMAVVGLIAMGAVYAAEQASLVGKAAPEITAKYWLNSQPLTLKGLQGKIVVVEFWATWCPPCRKSIPHLIELNKKFAEKGVVIMGLTDEPKTKVEPFAKEMAMDYAIGGESTSGGAYGVSFIPMAFIVDTAGTITWQGNPLNAEFEKALEEQLTKTPPKIETPKAKGKDKGKGKK
jgi:thiol-disulfide isomerase/thioredoxin